MFKTMTKMALAAAALAGAASSAHAYVFMRVADLAPDLVTIQSQKSCNTSDAQGLAAGTNCAFVDGWRGYAMNATTIDFKGTVGNFDITTTSGTTNIPGNASFANMEASSTKVTNLNANGTGLDTLYIDFRGFNFDKPTSGDKTIFGEASRTGTISGVGNGIGVQEIDTRFYADPSNAGGAVNEVDCTFAIAPGSFGCDTVAPVLWTDTPGTTFSLRMQQFFSIFGATQVNSTGSMVVRNKVPEPMTLALVSIALLGAGFAARNRKV